MNVRALVLGLALALTLLQMCVPRSARAASGTCPTSAARLAEQPQITLPADAKITAKEIAFAIDVGSDGRVRALQLDKSSGDGAVDMLTQQTLEAAKYEPAQTGCVALSSGMYIAFALPTPEPTPPPADVATATPKPTPVPQPTARNLNANCTPYIHSFITPVARDRKRTGSATVAVELDAAGTRTAEPVLKKSTGSPVLDQEALRIARTGQYGFELGTSCKPQAETYLLELTFL